MIDYTVIRSRRRTLALEVTRQGAALVRAPLRATDADIARFVDSHRGWLENIWQHGRPFWPPTRSRLRHRRMHGGSRQKRHCRLWWPTGPSAWACSPPASLSPPPAPASAAAPAKPSQLLPLPDGLSRDRH